jgi:hypothetical protein
MLCALTLAFVEQGDGLNNILAWLYVALRVGHSLVQSLINVIAIPVCALHGRLTRSLGAFVARGR